MSLFNIITLNNKEIEKLRDLLLPKLINNEFDVYKIEIEE